MTMLVSKIKPGTISKTARWGAGQFRGGWVDLKTARILECLHLQDIFITYPDQSGLCLLVHQRQRRQHRQQQRRPVRSPP